MLARFLYIATKGLVAVFGKHGFLADIGQSLEVTRVTLYAVPLILPSHFIIIISAYPNTLLKIIKAILMKKIYRMKINAFIQHFLRNMYPLLLCY